MDDNTEVNGRQQSSVKDRQLATQLQELTGLKVVSDQSCAAAIGSQQGYSNSDVTDDMLCAGGEVRKILWLGLLVIPFDCLLLFFAQAGRVTLVDL